MGIMIPHANRDTPARGFFDPDEISPLGTSRRFPKTTCAKMATLFLACGFWLFVVFCSLFRPYLYPRCGPCPCGHAGRSSARLTTGGPSARPGHEPHAPRHELLQEAERPLAPAQEGWRQICRTGASRICTTGTNSTICSTVRR